MKLVCEWFSLFVIHILKDMVLSPRMAFSGNRKTKMIAHPSPSCDENLLCMYMMEDTAAGQSIDHIPIYAYDQTIMDKAQLMMRSYALMNSELRFPCIPDQLLHLGEAGRWIHRVTCRRKNGWGAFRRFVARRMPEIPYPTPLEEGKRKFGSTAERGLLLWLEPLPGISHVDVHPPLVGSAMSADLALTAVTGRSVLVEVVGMLTSATSTDRDQHCAAYRARLFAKLKAYSALGSSHRCSSSWRI